MIFHENRLYFCRKFRKMSQNLLPAAVVIGTLRVNWSFKKSVHNYATPQEGERDILFLVQILSVMASALM